MKKTAKKKLPRLMNHGMIEEFKRDFKNSLDNGEPIDSDAILNWVQTTSLFYNWFYPRFEEMADRLNEAGEAYVMEPLYRPAFMEFSPWETRVCLFNDFVCSLARPYGVDYSTVKKAMQEVYRDYLRQWKESRDLRGKYATITVTFYHGGTRTVYTNSKRTDAQIENQYVGNKMDDMKNGFSRIVSVKIVRS